MDDVKQISKMYRYIISQIFSSHSPGGECLLSDDLLDKIDSIAAVYVEKEKPLQDLMSEIYDIRVAAWKTIVTEIENQLTSQSK